MGLKRCESKELSLIGMIKEIKDLKEKRGEEREEDKKFKFVKTLHTYVGKKSSSIPYVSGHFRIRGLDYIFTSILLLYFFLYTCLIL